MTQDGEKTISPIHTVGHSNRSAQDLIGLLRRAGITDVIDVRSTPYSRHVTQFNRENLKVTLNERDMQYLHLGDSLGGRPGSARLYNENGRADYRMMALEKSFQQGIEQVIEMAEAGRRPILMCAEGNPLQCHRALLVGHELWKREMQVVHITSAGRTESHDEMLGYLLTVWNKPLVAREGMNRRQIIEESVRRQTNEVAYQRR